MNDRGLTFEFNDYERYRGFAVEKSSSFNCTSVGRTCIGTLKLNNWIIKYDFYNLKEDLPAVLARPGNRMRRSDPSLSYGYITFAYNDTSSGWN